MNNIRHFFLVGLVAALFFTACDNGTTPPSGGTITIAAIEGITAPANGGTPVTVITDNAQYSGTVLWTPSDVTFQPNKAYYATITLTEKKGYTLEGVTKDFFMVAGALTVSNDENSGVITVVFPRTAGTIDNPAVIDIPAIEGVTAP